MDIAEGDGSDLKRKCPRLNGSKLSASLSTGGGGLKKQKSMPNRLLTLLKQIQLLQSLQHPVTGFFFPQSKC